MRGLLIDSLWHMMAQTPLVVEVRQSLFYRQCFMHHYLDVSSLGTFYPDQAASCMRFSILLLSNP